MRPLCEEPEAEVGLARSTRQERLVRLARQARGGDRRANEDLVGLLTDDVASWVRRFIDPKALGSALAEDAANSALLSIFRSIRLLDDPEKVVGWAWRIARRRAQELVTAESRRGTPLNRRLDDQKAVPAGGLSTEVECELRTLLDAARAELSPRRRQIVALCLEREFRYSEAANLLDCTVGTVKKELHVARGQLQRSLQDHGIEPSTTSRARKP